jgi:hypothetical protein
MKLFISYSRTDEAIVHLLSYILASKEITCLYDRRLPPAQDFSTNLQEMIKEADLVLLLLTKSAACSAWVNQEIGFATALQKPIWPLAVERDIQPHGLISTMQSYSLFDWSDPTGTISKLVETLTQYPRHCTSLYKSFGLKQVIQGRIPRTKFLIERLRELQESAATGLTVYNQAAFSIFCASDDPLYREAGEHSEEYMELLLEERRVLSELIEKGRIRLKLILWPVRAYDESFLSIRYKSLLAWMKSTVQNKNVTYVLAQYVGPNRYIVEGEFCLEGYKFHHTSGYEMSFVRYDKIEIAQALGEFNAAFKQGDPNKAGTIGEVERMYEKVSKLPGT